MDPMCDFDTDDDHTVYRVEVITKEYQTLPSIDYHPGWNFSVNSFFYFIVPLFMFFGMIVGLHELRIYVM